MKMYVSAIALTQAELQTYVAQLKSQQFETIGEATKAQDGSFYQSMVRVVPAKATPPVLQIAAPVAATT